MMRYKELFKPTLGKVLLTILLVLILPNFAYWSCCLEPPCSVEYKIHFGFEGLLFQTGLMTPKCGEFTYFYFWPLSILVSYLVSSLLVSWFINTKFMMKVKNKKLLFGFLAIIVLVVVMAGIWFSLDKTTRCGFIYGKNICNFYAMMDVANHNPSISDFDEMMDLCRDMTDVPKKDGCFEYVAQTIAPINMNKAKEACDEIKGFDGVKSREACYDRILQPFTKIEPTKEMVEKIVIYDSKQKGFVNEFNQESKEGIGLASLLTRKLHELNLQATCVFSEEDIHEIKHKDRVAELIFERPIDVVISQWVEPEERYHIPVDGRGYRILENVETALFILEDRQDRGLEAHILVGHEVEGRIGYSCWAINIKEEGKPELDKTWIDGINRLIK